MTQTGQTRWGDRTPIPARRPRAFTLVELLVVIGIIAVLVSMLLPALQRVRYQTQRVHCASNMHQWALGLANYAAGNKGYFPPNLDGRDVSWIGQTVIQFSTEFMGQTLNNWDTSDAAKSNHDHVMYCPTQLWHRYVRDTWPFANGGGDELVGYFYLPYRNPAIIDYTPAGTTWVTKQKYYANDARNAPILTDMIQTAGGTWGGPVPYSSHLEHGNNVPAGGNFMFEDGHVEWRALAEVDIGATMSGWEFHYKIQIDP